MDMSKAVAVIVGLTLFALPVAIVLTAPSDGPAHRTRLVPSSTTSASRPNQVQSVRLAAAHDLDADAGFDAGEEGPADPVVDAEIRRAMEALDTRRELVSQPDRDPRARVSKAPKPPRPLRRTTKVRKRGVGSDVPNRRVLEPKHVAFLLKDAGFPRETIPRMVCTAKYESLYDTRAKNVNSNGSHDTGLFQINDIWLKECGVTRKQLLNPRVNVACARRVFRESGYWAWYGYRHKQDKCKAFRLKRSTMIAIAD
jgi:hypothetical protein